MKILGKKLIKFRKCGPKSLFPAVFEIFGHKYIEVTTLTFLGHVTSSVT